METPNINTQVYDTIIVRGKNTKTKEHLFEYDNKDSTLDFVTRMLGTAVDENNKMIGIAIDRNDAGFVNSLISTFKKSIKEEITPDMSDTEITIPVEFTFKLGKILSDGKKL